MKNLLATIITFLVDLFTRKPQPVEADPTEVATDIIENPDAHTPEDVEAATEEAKVDAEEAVVEPDAPVDTENPPVDEVEVDAPEVDEEAPEVIEEEDATTTEGDLLEIGGGVEFE